MNTFIIASKNIEKGKEHAITIINSEKVSDFDREEQYFEKALGIEDVREVKKNIFLKPFRGEKKSLIIILNNSATIEAQNALLKLLEEPPASSLIFLITNNHLSFLPTILSRAKLIELKEEFEMNNLISLEEFENKNKFVVAQNLAKDKTEAINYITNLIYLTREKMIENSENINEAKKYQNIVKKLSDAYKDLKTTNANTRLVLENLALS